MRLVVRGDAFAHDHAGVVDRLGDGEKIETAHVAHRVEIEHLAADGNERVHGAVRDGRESDDHSRRVDPERAALISSQRSEIDPRFIGAQECVVSVRLRNIGRADDVRGVVAVRGAARAAERSEILHLAVLVNKSVERAVAGQSGTDDVPGRVNAVGGAGAAAECSEIGDGIIELCPGAGEPGEEDDDECERDFSFHGERMPTRLRL